MAFRPLLCQLKRIFQDSVNASAGHHRFLNHKFPVGAFKHAPAHRAIFTFGIFAHNQKINPARPRPVSGAGTPGINFTAANSHIDQTRA